MLDIFILCVIINTGSVEEQLRLSFQPIFFVIILIILYILLKEYILYVFGPESRRFRFSRPFYFQIYNQMI